MNGDEGLTEGMNTTEKKIPGREQKSPKVELSDENMDACRCPDCPTYNSDSCPMEKDEKVFCSIGMTNCGLEQKGCICGDCEVFKGNDLKVGYFCTKGEATDSGEPIGGQKSEE